MKRALQSFFSPHGNKNLDHFLLELAETLKDGMEGRQRVQESE